MNPFKLSDHLTGDYKLVFDKVNLHATLRGLAPTTEYEDAMLALFDMLYEHLYRLFLWVFCMESLNFILDYFILETPYLKSNVTPYLYGRLVFECCHYLHHQSQPAPTLCPQSQTQTCLALLYQLCDFHRPNPYHLPLSQTLPSPAPRHPHTHHHWAL